MIDENIEFLQEVRNGSDKEQENINGQNLMDLTESKLDTMTVVTANTFAGCRVLICDFHRVHAWARWVKKEENKVAGILDSALMLMRDIPKVNSREIFDTPLQS